MNQVPGAALRSDRIEAEDAADDDAVFEHVVVVVAPFAGRSASEVGGVEAQLGRGGGGDAASGCENQFRSTPPIPTPAEPPAILRGSHRA
jgi:hypothetical protein